MAPLTHLSKETMFFTLYFISIGSIYYFFKNTKKIYVYGSYLKGFKKFRTFLNLFTMFYLKDNYGLRFS